MFRKLNLNIKKEEFHLLVKKLSYLTRISSFLKAEQNCKKIKIVNIIKVTLSLSLEKQVSFES